MTNVMKYWRMNTDKGARNDVATCDLWYKHGMAFAGDFLEIGPYVLAAIFRKLSVGDGIFMHRSGKGLVGYGIVQEPWDGQVYEGNDRLFYVNEVFEYRIRVDWLTEFDRRVKPLPINRRLPYMGPYSAINPGKWEIEEVLRDMYIKECVPEFSFKRDVSMELFLEGGKNSTTIQTHAYNQEARKRCIEAYGCQCVICGFDFHKTYGDIGRGYTQVHHLIPMSSIGEEHEVDPVKDLRPVCANCHVMLHRRKSGVYAIDELRDILNARL